MKLVSATKDSIRSVSRYEQTTQPVPMSLARTAFPVAILERLPEGTGFSARQGQAKVDVKKTSGDTIEVTATCDSLSREVIRLTEELTRIRNDTTSVVTKPPDRVIREPTGFQWLQIWIGRIAILIIVTIVIKRRYGTKIISIIKSFIK
ncbi:MAG: hypothetical protein LBN29_01345 [Mediterranea sp.]|nr:hypothetical protein [Mediterranea sp.]